MTSWQQHAWDFADFLNIPESDEAYPLHVTEFEARAFVEELVIYCEEMGNGDLATVKYYKDVLNEAKQ